MGDSLVVEPWGNGEMTSFGTTGSLIDASAGFQGKPLRGWLGRTVVAP